MCQGSPDLATLGSQLSGLYVFGRPQDVAFQKARETGQRNKVRLWLAPVQFQGKPFWVGQISRSIGARPISENSVHKMDPDVDDSRAYLIQNLLYSQGLLEFGYVKGVGIATIMQPRVNLNGDPYITDGYRPVLWVSSKPIGFKKVGFVQWEKFRP